MRSELAPMPPLQDFSSVPPGTPPSGLHPMPEAEPAAVLAWLRRIRAGALVGMGAYFLHTILAAAAHLWLTSGEPARFLIPWIAIAVACTANWLMTSPGPGRRRWLWYLRWPVRIGVLLWICAGVWMVFFLVAYGGPTGSARNAGRAGIVAGLVLVVAPAACRFHYLSRLSARIGDRLLRRCFAVLGTITLILLVLAAISLATSPGSSEPTPAPTPPTDRGRGGMLIGWGIYVAGNLALAWLMWRVAKKLRFAMKLIAADEQGRLVEEPRNGDWREGR